MDYLLGRVKCCASVDELRQYRTAITAEGMLYQGYVARALSRERMDDAFIGRYAVTLRIRRLEEETAQLEDELARREPAFSVLSRQKQPLLLPYFVQKVVPPCPHRTSRGTARQDRAMPPSADAPDGEDSASADANNTDPAPETTGAAEGENT